jgi:hypothetical protein
MEHYDVSRARPSEKRLKIAEKDKIIEDQKLNLPKYSESWSRDRNNGNVSKMMYHLSNDFSRDTLPTHSENYLK